MNAVVAVIGAVAVVNLVLTMGVLRRLREQALSPAPGSAVHHEQRLPAVGAAVTDFHTVDVDGRDLSLHDLTGPAVVGFFTPGCPPCEALLPEFVAAAAEPGRQAIAVIVVDPGEDESDYRRRLAPAARTVVENPHGVVQRAFGADVFPTIAVLDAEHTIIASSFDVAALAGT
jgi:thiol-disulfide isomerase/thioredoxin